MYIHMNVCMRACMHARMYMCTCTHTTSCHTRAIICTCYHAHQERPRQQQEMTKMAPLLFFLSGAAEATARDCETGADSTTVPRAGAGARRGDGRGEEDFETNRTMHAAIDVPMFAAIYVCLNL